jgi:hypothetical protein
LPFLVKSDTHRLLGIFVGLSVHQSLLYLAFSAIVLAAAGMRLRGSVGLAIALLAVPTAFYWTMRLDQNVASRFFTYLPLGTALIVAANWRKLDGRRRIVLGVASAAWAVLLAMPLTRELRTFRDVQFLHVQRIAMALRQLPRHGTILTTESGFLPYFSGWTTYDAWGLNTPRFAHSFIRPEDIAELKPDLIVLHPDRIDGCVGQPTWGSPRTDRLWQHMTRNLVLGAEHTGYTLWLISYGSEFYRQRKGWTEGEGDRECIFVRNDSPLRKPIERVLTTERAITGPEALRLGAEPR